MGKACGYVHVEGSMSGYVSYTPFHHDPRGNRLERWEAASTPTGHVLRLRGPAEVVTQVQAVAPEYRHPIRPAGTTSEWTHELSSPGRTVRPEVRQLLELLGEVVSLPSLPLIRFAIALDWYKIPVDGVDSRNWSNTEIGELVSNGKYRYRNQEEPQRRVGRTLAGRICNAIGRHAALSDAQLILTIPGHDSRYISFGPRLAATVARYTKLPMLRVRATKPFRPEAKSLEGAVRALVLENQFIVPPEIRGYSALIVDDVFRSGGSMASVARAAHETGAREILGICAARTMRR